MDPDVTVDAEHLLARRALQPHHLLRVWVQVAPTALQHHESTPDDKAVRVYVGGSEAAEDL